LDQPVVIENKPGGQNIIGAQAAAKIPPPMAVVFTSQPLRGLGDRCSFCSKACPITPKTLRLWLLSPICAPFAVLVKADSPITSIQDLLAKSKAAPGRISLANEGPRTFGGIIARFLNSKSKMEANLVAYAWSVLRFKTSWADMRMRLLLIWLDLLNWSSKVA
jgi:tripartite-type tricarboxylate transporter receptor subunit TctC